MSFWRQDLHKADKGAFIALGSILFMMVFGWKINLYIDLSVIMAFICFLYASFKKDIFLNKEIVIFSTILFLFLLYSLLQYIIIKDSSLYYILRTIRVLIIFAGSYSLYIIYKSFFNEKTNIVIARSIFYIIFIHGLIIISMNFFPEFREFIYKVTNAKSYTNWEGTVLEWGYMNTGLTYSLAQTAALQAFGAAFLLFAYEIKHSKYFAISAFSVVILSVFLTGKSGFIILILVLYYYYVITSTRSYFRASFWFLLYASLITLSYYLFLEVVVYFDHEITFYHLMPNNVQSILNAHHWIITQGSESYFFDHYTEMLIYPDNWQQLIFGSGQTGRDSTSYVPTDIGYLRMLFSNGLLGGALLLLPFIYIFSLVMASDKKLKVLEHCLILSIIVTLVMNLKELSLMSRGMWTIQSLLCVAILLKEDTKRFKIMNFLKANKTEPMTGNKSSQ